jgi:target of EGR1 protein 1
MNTSYNIVNRHNIQTLSFAIKHAIQQSTFISIDIEFTGLGDIKKTRDQNIEDRYIACTQLAKEYAVIAVGLSTFKKSESGYIVNNFHFVMLSTEQHKVSPSSVAFLVEHGFDFNDQYRNGITYIPGNDVEMEQNEIQGNTIFRNILCDVLAKKCPVVVHNGLLDLVFLYHSFYAEIPSTLAMFIADLSDMFQGGIYDTKYISDFITREKASFLAYLFRK